MKRLFALPALAIGLQAEPPPLTVVPSVDLKRYAGTWYEIARYPNRFQRDCASDTVATYTLRPDGKITVLNQCRTAEGKTKSARGTARLADAKGPNSKLKVTFFWPFSGDYWIVGLDPDYRWAVIGEPRRNYLWILSRDKQLPPETLARIEALAREKGFDTGKLIRTPQQG
jgi:apolipoprotein D and lipocalin family protein